MYQPVDTNDFKSGVAPVAVVPIHGKPDEDEEAANSKFRDVWFGLLFVLNVSGICALGLWRGLTLVKSDSHHSNYSSLFSSCLVLSLVAFVSAVVWLKLVLAFTSQMIRFALWTNVVLMFIIALTTFPINPFLSLFLLLIAFFNICYIYAVQNRIAFASANLQIACAAVTTHKSIFAVALLLAVVHVVWLGIWCLGALGVYSFFRDADPNCDLHEKRGELCVKNQGIGGVVLFFLLLSIYWGQQVIKNVLTCTTAGTVASWWYTHPTATNNGHAVGGALYRSMTTSFGSICFGSLIVAVLQALRTMARILREKAQDDDNAALACVACLAECILNCLENMMDYFNQWAYVYVGIYGYDFRTSGKSVLELFETRGWTAVINDDLAGSALSIGAFGVGAFTCCGGLIFARFAPKHWTSAISNETTRYATFGTIGFIAGLSIAMILAAVLVTALHTVFVCFAEDPVALANHHPRHYGNLVTAWKQFQPDAWFAAYGNCESSAAYGSYESHV